MTLPDITRYRLLNQQIATTRLKQPEDVVTWMVAMQAQEFAMAKWAIGLRLPGVNDNDVERAFNEGRILRTHLMRPTWHFVSPIDIRWLLKLTAPRVHGVNAYMYRQTELDNAEFKKSAKTLTKALQGGKHLTRQVLQSALRKAGITAEGVRLSCIMMWCELEGIICSGPRQGKQFTYALLEERVPPVKELSRDEALATFAKRYFASRGPATVQDFAYWSGLTIKDAKSGAADLGSPFERELIDGREYIFVPPDTKEKKGLQTTFLMPEYDEYGMSYKDRSALQGANPVPSGTMDKKRLYLFVVNGLLAGNWQRTETDKAITISTTPAGKLAKTEQNDLEKAVKKYIAFTGKNSKDFKPSRQKSNTFK